MHIVNLRKKTYNKCIIGFEPNFQEIKAKGKKYMEKYCTEKSRQLHEETKKYLVDGVASSFQVPHYAKYPITMTHGKGSKLYDVDGNEYIDVHLNNWGVETPARAYNIRWDDDMDNYLALIIQSSF